MLRRTTVASAILLAATLSPLGRHIAADEPVLAGFSAQSSRVERGWEEKFRAMPDQAQLREYMQRLTARPHNVGSPSDKDHAE
jgi:N-acetylated-alpha-linked acidic dipeptidase